MNGRVTQFFSNIFSYAQPDHHACGHDHAHSSPHHGANGDTEKPDALSALGRLNTKTSAVLHTENADIERGVYGGECCPKGSSNPKFDYDEIFLSGMKKLIHAGITAGIDIPEEDLSLSFAERRHLEDAVKGRHRDYIQADRDRGLEKSARSRDNFERKLAHACKVKTVVDEVLLKQTHGLTQAMTYDNVLGAVVLKNEFFENLKSRLSTIQETITNKKVKTNAENKKHLQDFLQSHGLNINSKVRIKKVLDGFLKYQEALNKLDRARDELVNNLEELKKSQKNLKNAFEELGNKTGWKNLSQQEKNTRLITKDEQKKIQEEHANSYAVIVGDLESKVIENTKKVQLSRDEKADCIEALHAARNALLESITIGGLKQPQGKNKNQEKNTKHRCFEIVSNALMNQSDLEQQAAQIKDYISINADSSFLCVGKILKGSNDAVAQPVRREFSLYKPYGTYIDKDGEQQTRCLQLKRGADDNYRIFALDPSTLEVLDTPDYSKEGFEPQTLQDLNKAFAKEDLDIFFADYNSGNDTKNGSLQGYLNGLNFEILAAKYQTQNTLKYKTKLLANEPISKLVEEHIEKHGLDSLIGTGYSYNAGLYGENHAVQHRFIIVGILFELAMQGKIALHGSCGFMQDLVRYLGGNIGAAEDANESQFLEGEHGNDPHTVDEKTTTQLVVPYTSSAGFHEKAVVQGKKAQGNLKTLGNFFQRQEQALKVSFTLKRPWVPITEEEWNKFNTLETNKKNELNEQSIHETHSLPIVLPNGKPLIGHEAFELDEASIAALNNAINQNLTDPNQASSSTAPQVNATTQDGLPDGLSLTLRHKLAGPLRHDDGTIFLNANGEQVHERSCIQARYDKSQNRFVLSHLKHWKQVPLASEANPHTTRLIEVPSSTHPGTEHTEEVAVYTYALEDWGIFAEPGIQTAIEPKSVERTLLEPLADDYPLQDKIVARIHCVHTQEGIPSRSAGPGETTGISYRPNDRQLGKHSVLASSVNHQNSHPVAVPFGANREAIILEAMMVGLGANIADAMSYKLGTNTTASIPVITANQHHTDMWKEESGQGSNPMLSSEHPQTHPKHMGNRHGNREVEITGALLRQRRLLINEINTLPKNSETGLLENTHLRKEKDQSDENEVARRKSPRRKEPGPGQTAESVLKEQETKSAIALKMKDLDKHLSAMETDWLHADDKSAMLNRFYENTIATQKPLGEAVETGNKTDEEKKEALIGQLKIVVDSFENNIFHEKLSDTQKAKLSDFRNRIGKIFNLESNTPSSSDSESSNQGLIHTTDNRNPSSVSSTSTNTPEKTPPSKLYNDLDTLKAIIAAAIDADNNPIPAIDETQLKRLNTLFDKHGKVFLEKAQGQILSEARDNTEQGNLQDSSSEIETDESDNSQPPHNLSKQQVNSLIQKTILHIIEQAQQLSAKQDTKPKEASPVEPSAEQANSEQQDNPDTFDSTRSQINRPQNQRSFWNNPAKMPKPLTTTVAMGTPVSEAVSHSMASVGNALDVPLQTAAGITATGVAAVFSGVLAVMGVQTMGNANKNIKRLKAMASPYEQDLYKAEEQLSNVFKALNLRYRSAKQLPSYSKRRDQLLTQIDTALQAKSIDDPNLQTNIKNIIADFIDSTRLLHAKVDAFNQEKRNQWLGMGTGAGLTISGLAGLFPTVLHGIASLAGHVSASAKNVLMSASGASSAFGAGSIAIAGIVGYGAALAAGLFGLTRAGLLRWELHNISRTATKGGLGQDSGVRRAFNTYFGHRKAEANQKLALWALFTGSAGVLTVAGLVAMNVLPAIPLLGASLAFTLPLTLLLTGSTFGLFWQSHRNRDGKSSTAAEDSLHIRGNYLSKDTRRNRLINDLNNQIGHTNRNWLQAVRYFEQQDKDGFAKGFTKAFNLKWYGLGAHGWLRAVLRNTGMSGILGGRKLRPNGDYAARSWVAQHMAKDTKDNSKPSVIRGLQIDFMLRTTIIETNYLKHQQAQLQAELESIQIVANESLKLPNNPSTEAIQSDSVSKKAEFAAQQTTQKERQNTALIPVLEISKTQAERLEQQIEQTTLRLIELQSLEQSLQLHKNNNDLILTTTEKEAFDIVRWRYMLAFDGLADVLSPDQLYGLSHLQSLDTNSSNTEDKAPSFMKVWVKNQSSTEPIEKTGLLRKTAPKVQRAVFTPGLGTAKRLQNLQNDANKPSDTNKSDTANKGLEALNTNKKEHKHFDIDHLFARFMSITQPEKLRNEMNSVLNIHLNQRRQEVNQPGFKASLKASQNNAVKKPQETGDKEKSQTKTGAGSTLGSGFLGTVSGLTGVSALPS